VFNCYLYYVFNSVQYYKYFLYVASFQGLKSVFAGWFALYEQTRCLILRKMNAFQKDFPPITVQQMYVCAFVFTVCLCIFSMVKSYLYYEVIIFL